MNIAWKAKEIDRVGFFGLAMGVLPLLLAYTAQYGFSVPPCKLCIYQRIPYWVMVFSSVFAIYVEANILRKACIAILILSLLSSIAVSAFHVGVENHWVQYDSTCVLDRSALLDSKSYEEMLNGANNAPCNVVSVAFLGLSMASWNLIYSSLCVLLTYFKLLKY